jgi:hypothetical protein
MSSEHRRVHVPGRHDIGEVVDEHADVGGVPSVAVAFHETGEVLFFLADRVTDV